MSVLKLYNQKNSDNLTEVDVLMAAPSGQAANL